MAGLSLYDAYVPTLITILDSLESILTRAATYAEENNLDVNAEYIKARLYEDMQPLTFQIQVVSNITKSFVMRVGGVEVESWEDNETTFEQLFARINKTRELIKSVKPEDINGKESQFVELKAGPDVYKTTGLAYVSTFTIPNAFFHLQTTYAILRMKGVPLAKKNFLGPFLSKDLNSPYFIEK
ncbi:hypothetical protein Daus18300_012391 [Diaporthe australafricana]|uniref:Helix-turn-helix-domain containing protein type n=1 Tax=Diaporthe australafricana TaxID=127596 RepID=A0ABR3W2Y7_9PEZI